MKHQRDDFSGPDKDKLAKRAGFRCSNPNCRRSTSGASTDPDKTINIGVAAHITAASEGGPRYDSSLSEKERSSTQNGIWLCQNHAKLIDSDPARYSVELLHEWKSISEEAAVLDLETQRAVPENTRDDAKRILFYSQCLDRPAFKDKYLYDRPSVPDFDKAVEDTITAIATGCLQSRDGVVLARGEGKSFVSNSTWRDSLDEIVEQLRAMRSQHEQGIRLSQVIPFDQYGNRRQYIAKDPLLADRIEKIRISVLGRFARICKEAGVPVLRFSPVQDD